MTSLVIIGPIISIHIYVSSTPHSNILYKYVVLLTQIFFLLSFIRIKINIIWNHQAFIPNLSKKQTTKIFIMARKNQIKFNLKKKTQMNLSYKKKQVISLIKVEKKDEIFPILSLRIYLPFWAREITLLMFFHCYTRIIVKFSTIKKLMWGMLKSCKKYLLLFM